MKKRLQALILGGVLLAGASVPAIARDNVSFSLAFGVPAYTYYAPAPAYYYGPPAVSVYYRDGWRHHHRHHHNNYR